MTLQGGKTFSCVKDPMNNFPGYFLVSPHVFGAMWDAYDVRSCVIVSTTIESLRQLLGGEVFELNLL